jgi:hypothetical protein
MVGNISVLWKREIDPPEFPHCIISYGIMVHKVLTSFQLLI